MRPPHCHKVFSPMPNRIEIKTAALPLKATGTLVVYVAEGAAPTGAAAEVWEAAGLDWQKVSAAAGFKGKQGQVIDLLAPAGVAADRLLLLGSGKAGQGDSLSAWTDRGGSLAGKLAAVKATKAAVLLDDPEATPERIGELAAGLRLRHYKFDRYKPAKADDNGDSALTVTLHVEGRSAVDKAIADRQATAEGPTCWAPSSSPPRLPNSPSSASRSSSSTRRPCASLA
jgi:leucyl aminopeptidase